MSKATIETVICDFCGRNAYEIAGLIICSTNPDESKRAHICNECVKICMERVKADEQEQRKQEDNDATRQSR